MRIVFIKNSTIYKILAGMIIMIILLIFISNYNKNKGKETFTITDDVFYKGNVDNKTIAFTCNVDWGNEYIPLMLEIFKENNIKITFFVTGKWADQNEELLKKISEHGHEIGNHGFLHRDYSILSYENNKQEIGKAHNIISNIINTSPIFFAPPSGAYNDATIKAAKDLNYKVIMWSIDTIDWRKDSTSDKIINRVVSKTHNSAIVLMHPKEETIKALPAIIESLHNQGYSIGRVSDIIK